jgi:hypothetical protein
MFGHHFLIQNLFYFLAFLSPQVPMEAGEMPQSSFEVVITIGHHQSSGIIELISLPNQLVKTSQNIKLPFVPPFEEIQGTNLHTYRPKLLYFNIGDTLELELTSTVLIFPFHCFT